MPARWYVVKDLFQKGGAKGMKRRPEHGYCSRGDDFHLTLHMLGVLVKVLQETVYHRCLLLRADEFALETYAVVRVGVYWLHLGADCRLVAGYAIAPLRCMRINVSTPCLVWQPFPSLQANVLLATSHICRGLKHTRQFQSRHCDCLGTR